jgi:penicillin-binding protein 1A
MNTSSESPEQPKPPERPSWRPRLPNVPLTRRLLRSSLWVGAALTGAAAIYIGVLIYTTPSVTELKRAQGVRPSVILSADGELIGRFAVAYEAPVTLKNISPDLINALIATEDKRFYEHHGIDWRRLVASVWNTLHGETQGGSTITQQLARNLFPQEIGNDRNLNRKLREAITALRLERASTKEQILESYLNVAPFLYNVRGVEMAARTYFNQSAAKLDTAQAATLVGMLKGSQRYNPVRNPERARERRNLVLAQMVKNNALTPERYAKLSEQKLQLVFKRPEDSGIGQARHFVAHLRDRMAGWAESRNIDLDSAGLVIHTTLDAKLQKIAQDALVQQVALLQRIAGEEWREARPRTGSARQPAPPLLRNKEPVAPFDYFWKQNPELLAETARDSAVFRTARQQGQPEAQALTTALADHDLITRLRSEKTTLSAGFIAMDPTRGTVKAWVGSPDFGREQFDHVYQAKRQPGSTFKPFVYGAALQQGLSTETTFPDTDIEIELATGDIWRPTDINGPSGAMLSLRQGLVMSKNTITAQVMQEVGPDAVVDFARAAGVRDSKLDPVPSLALGTSPVSLLEMASAYATLAALGTHREPLLITRIADREGHVLETFDNTPERVLDQSIIEQLVDVMRGVVRTGTGRDVRNEWSVHGDLAGKTGTTQNNTDGWFMLMSPKLVTGAWVGFNDQRVSMRSSHWGQGGHNALRIVGSFMQQAQKAKLIDTKATFPQVVRPPPEARDPVPTYLDAKSTDPLDGTIPTLPNSPPNAAPEKQPERESAHETVLRLFGVKPHESPSGVGVEAVRP